MFHGRIGLLMLMNSICGLVVSWLAMLVMAMHSLKRVERNLGGRRASPLFLVEKSPDEAAPVVKMSWYSDRES